MKNKYVSFAVAIFILAIIFQVYLYTVYPAFNSDDSPETIISSYTLGIGHPPSYPLFTLAGKVFSLLPVGSPAFRINLFSTLLAMIILLLTYSIINQFIFYIFGYKNRFINIFGVVLLAFSYIFWNQCIEAKGGIYILNLLFLAALIYLSMELFKSFNIKWLYLISFIFGLSLSNHWPSTIILLPVFGYLVFKYRKKIARKNILNSFLFTLVGLSPYLYLPIRAVVSDVYIYAFKPNTWESFWWTVLRSGYVNDIQATLQVYKYQIKEFLTLLLANYYFLWILMLAGGYATYKKSKELFFFYISMALIIVFMVIIYNRGPENMMWQTGVFLMPALYILFLFIIVGIYYILNFIKTKIVKNFFLSAVLIATVIMGYTNFNKNNNRYNFQAYDFGNNILKTMEPNSLYLCEGDYVVVPYIQLIEKQRTDIQLVNAMYLPLKIGTDVFTKKGIPFKENDPKFNFESIINCYLHNNFSVYRSTISPYTNKLGLNYNFAQAGLLQKWLTDNKTIPSSIYKLYSYNREHYDKYMDNSGRNMDLIMNYPFCMINQGNDLIAKRNTYEALQLFIRATYFPFIGMMKENKPAFYYDLSNAYRDLNDHDNQIKYLKMAIDSKTNLWQAYDTLGMIYFKDEILPMAKDMFEKAVQYGDSNVALQTYISNINTIDLSKQYDAMFNVATDMLAKGKGEMAIDLYDFLLKHNYGTAVINKNIGVFYLKADRYEEAMKYFQKSKEASPAPDVFTFIAFDYYKTGLLDKEMEVLKEGLKLYPDNQQILQLYNQLSQSYKK